MIRLAESFSSIQGEGCLAGTPMAHMRQKLLLPTLFDEGGRQRGEGGA